MKPKHFGTHNRWRSGLSFIEIILSVAIIGIIAAIASPIYANSLLKYRADVSVQRIVQDVAQTQRLARQTNSSRSITFTLNDDSYEINGLSSLDRASSSYKVILSQPPYQSDLNLLVTLNEPATPLPSLTLVFDRFGMPNQGISITLNAGNNQKRITIAPTTGRASVQ